MLPRDRCWCVCGRMHIVWGKEGTEGEQRERERTRQSESEIGERERERERERVRGLILV